MKQLEFEALIKKYLLPSLPGFAVKGGLLFTEPIGLLLHTIVFVPSIGDKNKFHVDVIIQPLYLLKEYIVCMYEYDLWSVKERSLIGQRWLYNGQNIEDIMIDIRLRICDDVIKWFNEIQTPIDLINNGIHIHGMNDPYHLQSVVYSWIISGKQAEASKAMERWLTTLRGYESPYPWQVQLLEEATRIDALLRDDITKAQAALYDFRRFTLQHLKLEKWASEIG